MTYLAATNTYCYMVCFNVSLRDALESFFLDRQNIALTDPDTLEEFAMLPKNERLFVYGRFETKRKKDDVAFLNVSRTPIVILQKFNSGKIGF